MAGPGPEPGRGWRALALCGAALFLAAAAAGGALVAWNLAASTARGPRCPEPGTNATTPPPDLAPELEELQRQLAEAAQREESLAGRLRQAERVREELEQALRACEGRQVGGQGGGVRSCRVPETGTRTHVPKFPSTSFGFLTSSVTPAIPGIYLLVKKAILGTWQTNGD